MVQCSLGTIILPTYLRVIFGWSKGALSDKNDGGGKETRVGEESASHHFNYAILLSRSSVYSSDCCITLLFSSRLLSYIGHLEEEAPECDDYTSILISSLKSGDTPKALRTASFNATLGAKSHEVTNYIGLKVTC